MKMVALMNYLKKEGVIGKEEYDPCIFKVEAGEYMVLNKHERYQKAKEYIRKTLWAFYPSFLAEKTGLPEKVFQALSEKCEDGNDTILALVERTCGLDTFVKSAIEADGYGHFLAPYDGKEGREVVEGEEYFIYRIN